MPKLVVLSEGMNGRSYELTTVLTTIGRLEDNSFQIPEPSVSSHHCEVMLRGTEILIKDLNSTNGTFVNGQRIVDEAIVHPGQIIRLGQIEFRMEGDPGSAPPPQAKKPLERTGIIPQGVNLTQSDQGAKTVTFDKNSPFAKKSNSGSKRFLMGAIALIIILLLVILYMVFFRSRGIVGNG